MVEKVYEVVVVASYLKDEMSGGVRSADTVINTSALCVGAEKNTAKLLITSKRKTMIIRILSINDT